MFSRTSSLSTRRGGRVLAAGMLAALLGVAGGPGFFAPAQDASAASLVAGQSAQAAETITPKGPTFRDDRTSVYIPSDRGVRYRVRQWDGTRSIEVTWPESGLDYAKPGEYGTAQGLDPRLPLQVEAVPAGSSVALTGTTSWAHLLTGAGTDPVFDQAAGTVTIPEVPGVEYRMGQTVLVPGRATDVSAGGQTVVTAVSTQEASRGQELNSWTRDLAAVVTPKGPTFDEGNGTVYIPSDQGVRYHILVDGQEIAKEGLAYAKPGLYTAEDGVRTGVPLVVTAVSAGSSTVLHGSTRWERTFEARPAYGLETGDEFNDSSSKLPAAWNIYTTKAATLKAQENTVYRPENVSVKDGNLEIRTERHCLATGQEPDAGTVSPGGAVCPQGKRTVYTSGRINTGFLYHAPFSMEIRARMSDQQIDGMHFAGWLRNDQPYCTQKGVTRSSLAELDTMEIFSQHAFTTNTSHITCTAQANGEAGTKRDGHQLDTQIAGAWHTFGMTYDGHAIRYFLDGQLVPSSWGQTPETTAAMLGLGEEEFRTVMSQHPYQLIIDSLVFPQNTSWIHPPRNDQPFPARVDRVDYVRIHDIPDVAPHGAVGAAWRAHPELGQPVGPEVDAGVPGGRQQEFDGGVVYWSPTTGAHIVRGAIRGEYRAQGGPAVLGLPSTDEQPLGGGVSQVFQRGQIHWSGRTGAHTTHGAVQALWAAQGWEKGQLGYPTGSELTGLAGGGASQTFQGGTVFWSPSTGAAAVKGGILGRYGANGWESGALGYPLAPERSLRGGASQRFQGGQIHWSARTGAHATGGAIQDAWAARGWENGWLGYPTSEEVRTADGGVRQTFRGGAVTWYPARALRIERW